jgi:hypothetical protein
VRASNAATLQGHSFEAAGSIAGHAAEPDGHHSATSDGVAIPPASTDVGDTRIESASVVLGPDATDTLTASIVQTLTARREADALHIHAGAHGSGSACYQVFGTANGAEGFVRVSHRTLVNILGSIRCIDTRGLTPTGGTIHRRCSPLDWVRARASDIQFDTFEYLVVVGRTA